MSMEKVAKVNEILLKGEPENISVDEHSGYTGYKPQSVVDAMNEVFWGEWGFKEISSEIIASEKGGLAVAQVQVWIKGVEFQPTSYGQNRVTRGDIGDARKGAQTDAIKKALSYFSIGNRAYHGLLPDKKEQAQARQQTSTQRQSTPAARAQATTKPAQETPKTDERPAPRGANVDNGQAQIPPEVRNLKSRANQAGLVHNLAEWMALKEKALGHAVKDVDLTEQQIKTIENHMAAKAS